MVLGLLALSAAAASATPITLALGDIAGFSQLSSTDAATLTVNNGIIPAGTAVTITTIFAPPQTGLQSASVGLSGLNIGFNPGDAFLLQLENTDENAWTFQLVTVTDQGTFMSAAQSLTQNSLALFSASLGGVAGNITSTFFVVAGNVPFPDGDRTAEYEVSPASSVPEPTSVLFLASGLAAIGILGRKRRLARGRRVAGL